ncbi:MAG: TIGR03936 family radical SAM-associated protein [Anaerolineales bacterium]
MEQRIRVHFSKTEAMRYTGHLDLQRAWERLLRRAALPVIYSQGFNPRPRIQLAAALPLGFTSQAEIADFWLETRHEIPVLQTRLEEAAPPGIRIQRVEEIPEGEQRAPALQSIMHASEYIITLLSPFAHLNEGVAALLTASTLPRTRRKKAYDLRPLIFSLEVLSPDEAGNQRLRAVLSARESATGRPEEVLAALGIPAHLARVHRTALHYEA